MFVKKNLWIVSAGVGGLTLSVAAAAVEDSSAQPAQLEQVVVTATRRQENLIDVPVSAAVTSGEMLERLNLNGAEDLVKLTPGLTIAGYNTPRGAGFKVRGIGTNVFADGVEQSVGTVVDGIPLARAGQGLADLIDVERIEVLRGPQGLLFGRNASAGLINIVTRRPTDTLTYMADASYGSGNQVKLAGSVAGPLSEALSARLTGYTNQEDGFVRNIGTGQEYNGRDEKGLRGQLLWAATDDLEVILRADYSKRDNACCMWSVRQFATPATDPRPAAQFLSNFTGPIGSGPDARSVNVRGDIFNRVESAGGSLEVNWTINGYTITSLTGDRTWEQEDNNDADLSPFNVLDRNYGANDLRQFSQELRLTSPKDQFIDFVAGLFYYDTSNDGFFQQVGRFTLGLAAAQAAGLDLTLAPGLVLPASANFGRDVRTLIDVTDTAAFGQANVNFTDATRLILGARLTRTEVEMDYARAGTPDANAYNFLLGGAFAPLAFETSTSDTSVSWQVGLAHEVGDDGNVYATVTRGYKGPGYNSLLDITIPAGRTPDDFTRVRPEVPTSFEVGYKANLFDSRVRLSADVFYTQFEDFQAQVIEQQPNGLRSFAIRNAGKLISRGAEAELEAALSDNLTVGAMAAYTDAYFDDFKAAACPAGGALVTTVGAPCGPEVAGGPNLTFYDASGEDAAGAPKWTAALTFDAHADIGASAWQGFLQGIYNWRSATTFVQYPENIPNPTREGAYALLNLALGASSPSGEFTFSVYVNNVLDETYAQGLAALPFDGIGGVGQFVGRDMERTYGVKLSVRH